MFFIINVLFRAGSESYHSNVVSESKKKNKTLYTVTATHFFSHTPGTGHNNLFMIIDETTSNLISPARQLLERGPVLLVQY
jgi:hypothetical protein